MTKTVNKTSKTPKTNKTTETTITATFQNVAEPKVAVVKTTPKKVRIAGEAVIVTSTLKFEAIKNLEKYDRDLLCLFADSGEESVEAFRISTGAKGVLSKYGIVFTGADKNGYATTTVLLPEGIENKVEYIKERFGNTIVLLTKLEECAEAAAENIAELYAMLDKEIEEV